MTTYTTRFRLPLITRGQRDWDTPMGLMFGVLDQSLGQVQSISLATGNVTLTNNNNASDQSRAALSIFTGTGGAKTVTLPNIERIWPVFNHTNGAVTFSAGAGADTIVPRGCRAILYTKADTVVYSFWNDDQKVVPIAVTEPDGADLVVGDGQAYFRVPAKMNSYQLRTVAASLCCPSTGAAPQIRVRNRTVGVSMLTTNITIDANEKDSKDAAIPAVVDETNNTVSTGDQIAIDIIVAGTTANGLNVELTFSPE